MGYGRAVGRSVDWFGSQLDHWSVGVLMSWLLGRSLGWLSIGQSVVRSASTTHQGRQHWEEIRELCCTQNNNNNNNNNN